MIQLCVASTLYGAATLAATVDAGLLGAPVRRVLVISNNAETPEAQPGPQAQPGFAELARRFDAVVSWNEIVHPFHPTDWRPRAADATLWERLLRQAWNLGDGPLELVLESIQAPPALALAGLFLDAPIRLYSDGLMTYGPSRRTLGDQIGTRLAQVLYLELIAGLRPLVAREYGPAGTAIPSAAFTSVLAEVSAATPPTDDLPSGCALIVGQYLSAAELISEDQERALYVDMVRRAVALGHRELVFKPHPTAPRHWQQHLAAAAAAEGARLSFVGTACLAEVLYERLRPAVVIGCFSTALLTASAFYGLPVAQVGTALLSERLTPFANSNRVPVALVDALVPSLAAGQAPRRVTTEAVGGIEGVSRLVATLAYCMQPTTCDDLRGIAVDELRTNPDRYRALIPRSRLGRLGLPGARLDLSLLLANHQVRRAARQALAAPNRMRRRLARALG